MSDEQFEAFTRALEAKDIERIVGHYTEDAVFVSCPGKAARTLQGREALRSMFRGMFRSPESQFHVSWVLSSGGRAAAEWTFIRPDPQDGRRQTIYGASIFELRDGKVVRETIYYDHQPEVG